MKKYILLLSILLSLPTLAISQDRVNDNELALSYKSKEIKRGIFWSFDDDTGKWESRKNTSLIWEWNRGDFKSIFIGECKGNRYIFINHSKGFYEYKNIREGWYFINYMKTALVSNDEYKALENLQLRDTVAIAFKTPASRGFGDRDFNEYLRYATKRCSFDELSEREISWLIRDEPNLVTFIRVLSDGEDVVRFIFRAPDEGSWLSNFDTSYFEIPYKSYLLLFQKDKSIKFR